MRVEFLIEGKNTVSDPFMYFSEIECVPNIGEHVNVYSFLTDENYKEINITNPSGESGLVTWKTLFKDEKGWYYAIGIYVDE